MTNLLGFLLALWVSFIAVWAPWGMKPSMPEFWLTPWLYGAPLLILAWPLYLTLFRRVRKATWWKLAAVGFLLSPVPFCLLATGNNVIKGNSPLAGFSLSYFVPWTNVYAHWYGLFGVLFGAWVGLWSSSAKTPDLTRYNSNSFAAGLPGPVDLRQSQTRLGHPPSGKRRIYRGLVEYEADCHSAFGDCRCCGGERQRAGAVR